MLRKKLQNREDVFSNAQWYLIQKDILKPSVKLFSLRFQRLRADGIIHMHEDKYYTQIGWKESFKINADYKTT